MGIVRRRAGSRGGSGGLGASTVAQFPLVGPAVGLVGKYGPGPGKGQWRAWAQGGLRRSHGVADEAKRRGLSARSSPSSGPSVGPGCQVQRYSVIDHVLWPRTFRERCGSLRSPHPTRAYLCASASQTTAPRPARNTRNAIMISHCITAPPVHRSFDMHDG